MKYVFVETNFLIELARPVPNPRPRAQQLYERAQRGEVHLLLPWCSVTEAKRTIEEKINDDFAFRKGLERYAASRRKQAQVRALLADAKIDSIDAQNQREQTIDQFCTPLEIILPSADVVARTMLLFPVKSLPPFDEMTLGAVLCRAEQLHVAGERDLWFCNLNKKDFSPGQDDSPLARAYTLVGLTYLDHFGVPP